MRSTIVLVISKILLPRLSLDFLWGRHCWNWESEAVSFIMTLFLDKQCWNWESEAVFIYQDFIPRWGSFEYLYFWLRVDLIRSSKVKQGIPIL